MARWVAVLVFVALCAGATWLELQRSSVLTVEIGSAMPSPDPEDWDNTLGDRYWHVNPEVTIRLNRTCHDLRIATDARALSNGRPVPAWDAHLGGGHEAPGRHPAGFVVRVRGSAYGVAGYAIVFRAGAACRRGRHTENASAESVFQLPAATCSGGPLRVFDVRGDARVTDADWEVQDTYPLRVGHLVRRGWELEIPPGGQVVLGAPECNGLRVRLGPGRHVAGSYDAAGRGDAFAGSDAEMTGDSHAGGLHVGATVEPLGFRCRGCGSVVPATFATRRVSATRSVVRVEVGTVRVRAIESRLARVRAGQQLSIVCRSARKCTLIGLRAFQPTEPWESAMRTGVGPFAGRLVTRRGARPPRSRLAPAGSQIRLIVLPASTRVPEQLFVVWNRTVRGRSRIPIPDEVAQQGVMFWQAKAAGGRSVWRLVFARRLEPHDYPTVDVGDMSGDGHPEVLYAGLQGSGGCGVRRLLVTTSRGVKEVLRHESCESRHELRDGVFHLREVIGPCPERPALAHCFGGVKDTQMRWDGRRLVTVRSAVRCTLARLDPKRGCRPRL